MECPPCRMFHHGRFELHELRDHFRYCHLGNISYADQEFMKPCVSEALSQLMQDPEIEQILQSLLDDCSVITSHLEDKKRQKAAKSRLLPSACLFIARLRPYCNGKLACVSPRCKGLETFNPTWDALKRHYRYCLAADIFQNAENAAMASQFDVDSHFNSHKKSVERLCSKASDREREWAMMDDDTKTTTEAINSFQLQQESRANGRIRKSPQLLILKDLNRNIHSRYRKFFRLVEDPHSPELHISSKKLKAECPKARNLRRLGNRVFKAIIRNKLPTSTLEIFAFFSLATAMTTVMKQQGVPINSNISMNDLKHWRTSLHIKEDQELYDQLVNKWFHPGVSEESIVDALGEENPATMSGSPSVHEWFEQPSMSAADQSSTPALFSMRQIVMHLMRAKRFDTPFNFSAFLPPRKSICSRKNDLKSHGGHGHNEIGHQPAPVKESDGHNDATRGLKDTQVFVKVQIFMICKYYAATNCCAELTNHKSLLDLE